MARSAVVPPEGGHRVGWRNVIDVLGWLYGIQSRSVARIEAALITTRHKSDTTLSSGPAHPSTQLLASEARSNLIVDY